MKSEYRLFLGLALFLFGAAAVYGWWTDADSQRIEWIGMIALILSGLLCSMCGGYFWFVARRIDPRPEDRPDAEIADGAGDIGFFSPGSYYPFGVALATAIVGVGMAYTAWWLIAAGMIAVIVASSGLLFEYYTGSRRGAEH
jgi:hypothetical protein